MLNNCFRFSTVIFRFSTVLFRFSIFIFRFSTSFLSSVFILFWPEVLSFSFMFFLKWLLVFQVQRFHSATFFIHSAKFADQIWSLLFTILSAQVKKKKEKNNNMRVQTQVSDSEKVKLCCYKKSNIKTGKSHMYVSFSFLYLTLMVDVENIVKHVS